MKLKQKTHRDNEIKSSNLTHNQFKLLAVADCWPKNSVAKTKNEKFEIDIRCGSRFGPAMRLLLRVMRFFFRPLLCAYTTHI